jgi:hypothetical protein
VDSLGFEADAALIAAAERDMRDSGAAPDAFFHRHRGGAGVAQGDLGALLEARKPTAAPFDHPAPSLVIEEVERIWSAIAERDDWQPLTDAIAAIRHHGAALGDAPVTPVTARH